MGALSALQALTSGSNREFSAHGTGEIAGGVLDTDGDLMELSRQSGHERRVELVPE